MCASGVIRLIFTLGCIRVTRLEVLIACALATLVLLTWENRIFSQFAHHQAICIQWQATFNGMKTDNVVPSG